MSRFARQVAEAEVLYAGSTYFIKGSVLPVYLNDDGDMYLIEEYEKENPCEHAISDMLEDGVRVLIKGEVM